HEITYLTAETHGMDGDCIRIQCGIFALQAALFFRSKKGNPCFVVALMSCLDERTHTQSNVAHQSNACASISANVFACKITPDDPGVRRDKWRLTMIEAEVQAC